LCQIKLEIDGAAFTGFQTLKTAYVTADSIDDLIIRCQDSIQNDRFSDIYKRLKVDYRADID